jgi:hypothetical protein
LLLLFLLILKAGAQVGFLSLSPLALQQSSVYLLPSYTSFAAASDSRVWFVFQHSLPRLDHIKSISISIPIEFRSSIRRLSYSFPTNPNTFFLALFPHSSTPAHSKRHNRPTVAEEGEHSFVVCFVCPDSQPARIRFRLASSRLRNCPPGLSISSQTRGAL